MADPPVEETYGALWCRVQTLEAALRGNPQDRRARALVTQAQVELARVGRRLGNPTQARLSWIAGRYPTTVLLDVVYVWAEATGQHELKASLCEGGNLRPLDARAVLDRVQAFAVASERGDVRAGRTRFDRYLPWLAREIGGVHKRAIQVANAYGEQLLEDDGAADPLHARVASELADATEYRDVWTLAGAPPWPAGDLVPERVRARQELAAAMTSYEGAVGLARDAFRGITDWARHERVDLGRLRLATAAARAHAWAQKAQVLRTIPQGTVVYRWPDGWTVQQLNAADELKAEGRILHHCVDDYPESNLVAHGGDVEIFSLRDPSGRPVVTLEWLPESGTMTQVRQVLNAVPTDPAILWRLVQFRHSCARMRGPWRPDADVPGAITRVPGWQGRYRSPLGGERFYVVDVVRGRPHNAEHLWAHMHEAFERSGDEDAQTWLAQYEPSTYASEAKLDEREDGLLRWTHYVTTGHFSPNRDGVPADELAFAIWVATRFQSGPPLPALARIQPPPSEGASEGSCAA